MAMTRQFISEQRLLAKINAKLASDSVCGDCTVSSLMRVESDQTGCNWSVAAISGPFNCGAAGSSRADKVIETFKALYNFAD